MSDGPAIRYERHEIVTVDRPRYTARVIEDLGRNVRVQLWAPTLERWHFTVDAPREWLRAFDPELSPTPSDYAPERSAA